MKNFDWTTFTRRIAVKSTLTEIYNAWTKPQEIEKWFLRKSYYFDLNNKAIERSANVSKDDHYEWSWYGFDVVEKGKINQANGKDFLQFTFAGNCLVDINLKQEKEYVIVELTQKNIPTDDNSKQDVRLGCDSGWSFFLVNLKAFYENGVDLRNKDANLKGMINN
jgi:uncharacterized protein YndB with AHSA1/START domain